MLKDSDISIVQPQTPEEVDQLAADIWQLLPPETDSDYLGSLRTHPKAITLIYHENKPISYIEMFDNEAREYLGAKSLEFGGAVHPDYTKSHITTRVAPAVIRKRLREAGKEKVLATAKKDDKIARRALSNLGFKFIGNAVWSPGNALFKLDTKKMKVIA